MAYFSHSQLEMFSQCKLKYKFRYIDKVIVEVPKTIEAFFGDIVHQTLRELYEQVRKNNIPDLASLKNYFLSQWKKQWENTILINSGTQEEYCSLGLTFIEEYYKLYYPFTQEQIIGLETNDKLMLPNGDKYFVRIDKLAKQNGTYLICDYKTAKRMPTLEQMQKDRQLAMYSLWVKQAFSDCTDVKLVWYYLAHNQKIEVIPDSQMLKQTQEQTMRIIGEIKSTSEYPANPTKLCDWCVYKSICPAWNKPAEQVSVKEHKQKTLDFF